MCGRFTPIPRPQVLELFKKEFGIGVVEGVGQSPSIDVDLLGGGQCLPFHDIDAIFADGTGRFLLEPMQWQLIHNWNRDFRSDYTNFNTRIEKLGKSHNRELLCRSRCVIPVAEFFENRKVGGKTVKPKQCFRFTVKGQSIIPLGGIYSLWTNPDNASDQRHSCSIITMEPNELVGEVHNRMPYIIPSDTVKAWLDPGLVDFEAAMELIGVFDADLMVREAEVVRP